MAMMMTMTSASASASPSQRLTGRHPHRFPGGGAPVARRFPRTSNMYLSQKAIGVSFFWTDMVDLNQHICFHSTAMKKCSLRQSLSSHKKLTLSCRWLEFKKHLPPFRKAARTVYPPLLASTDDGVTVNGAPQANSYSEMEEIRVKLNQSLQGEDVSGGLVQSIHDAARAVELAILENSSSSKASWFSKAWLGLDKNARVKTLSYQAAVYSLLQAAIEISSRGEGRDRDMNVFVQRSLSRQCAPLESTIRDELSTKQPEAYEWFWSQQHPMVVTSFVNMFERDPRFSSATMPSWKGDSSGLGGESDISLLMLALSCLAAVTKLGSAKVYCSEFFSMIPDVTGRLMDMLLDYLPIQKAYYSMKDIGLRREFLLHFGPWAASGKAKKHEEIVFWVDLIQRQLQRAIDRERIWSRLTTCESIEVLENDLAIFGFFIALGRSTKSFLSSNNFSVMDDSIESFVRYLIGGSVLYYPQLSSISSYQLYVEVVCEELEWLPFYQTKSANAKQILEENIKQDGISQQEAVLRILDVCSYWMTSFIKYSTLLENPSNIKAARFLSKGHNMLNECKKEAGVLKTGRKNNIVEYQGQQESRTKEFVEAPLDSFDKALESVEGALNRLEDLLQELHLSNSNPGNEHLKAACSDLERIRKLKKEAEFLEASFKAKTALLVEEGDADEQSQSTNSEQQLFSTKKASNISKESEIDSKPLQSNKQGFWSFLVRNSTRKTDPGLSKRELNISNTIKDTQDSESNEIRRFELLRSELIELERRVQRSTDDTQNDEDSDLIDVKKKRASTLGHLMLVPREKKDNMLAKSFDKIKETGTDVWQGTQLLAFDAVAALVLLRRALSGDELTEKEKKALRRTLTDLASVVPIGILMLLPVTAVGHAAMLAAIQRYVPSLIPSTYGPERLSLLRELEKVKQMETTEMTSDETTDDLRLTLKDSENQ